MVQRIVQMLAGPRTYELVSAHLVNRVTPPAPQGHFTLAMDPGRADGVALTLRVHLDSSATLKLGFGSGQTFDVLVSDEAGNLVHRWSDGHVFDQSLHSMVVEREWSARAWIPRPAPGRYTVQAWLTTSSTGVPLYAATAPLVIDPVR